MKRHSFPQTVIEFASAVIVIFLLSSCATETIEVPTATSLPLPIQNTVLSRAKEELNVYAVLLNENPNGYIDGNPILVVNRTDFYKVDNEGSILETLSSLDKTTLDDYLSINKQSQSISSALPFNKPYQFIEESEVDRYVTVSWREFEQKYPNGYSITTFSRVGFNEELTQAFVYMENYCGGECGTANLYFLTRDGSGWKITGYVGLGVY